VSWRPIPATGATPTAAPSHPNALPGAGRALLRGGTWRLIPDLRPKARAPRLFGRRPARHVGTCDAPHRRAALRRGDEAADDRRRGPPSSAHRHPPDERRRLDEARDRDRSGSRVSHLADDPARAAPRPWRGGDAPRPWRPRPPQAR
jgi:hypothetical protein